MTRRTFVSSVVVVASLLLLVTAAPSRAELACTEIGDAATQAGQTPNFAATCDSNEDCGAVGGIECSNGLCFCPEGRFSPYCPCEGAQMAPAMSPA